MTRVSRGTAAVVVAALGALVLVSALPTWVTGTTPTATGDLAVRVSGTAASPTTASIGLVIVAAGLLLGLAGRGMRIFALLAVIAGGAVAAGAVIIMLQQPEIVARAAAAEITSVRAINLPVGVTLWPYVSVVVLALAVAVAVWLITHLGTWASVGRRYETAGRTPVAAQGETIADQRVRARRKVMDDWDAISRGEDPT